MYTKYPKIESLAWDALKRVEGLMKQGFTATAQREMKTAHDLANIVGLVDVSQWVVRTKVIQGQLSLTGF